ncbi:Lrp/AsnC family transcriptional regulator [Pedobacter nyackensis]|uniref:Lrp/AsnC family transcriptional regulator n=1 Tax=Pedobacter nyackensis TaxID=475255 RepID=UPI00292DF940|nr:Lrp/AsnC family transcriptional regulator [Pedobacter nyackensis]
MAFKLDKFDLNLLVQLQKNARISAREISHKIHLSASAVSARIRRLESDGYILRYITILNKSMVNKNLVCFTGVRLSQNNNENLAYFAEQIKDIPEVYNCYHVNEMFDFLLHMVAKDMQDYHHFLINTLSNINSVCNITTFFVLSEMEDAHNVDLSHLFDDLN